MSFSKGCYIRRCVRNFEVSEKRPFSSSKIGMRNKQAEEGGVPKRLSLSETSFYILLALQEERHGYEIRQWVHDVTDGEFELPSGTVYNSLTRLEAAGVIRMTREESRRKYYCLTELGEMLFHDECTRLHRIYQNSYNMLWKRGERGSTNLKNFWNRFSLLAFGRINNKKDNWLIELLRHLG